MQSHTETEFNKAIDALGAGLGIFAAEECDAILMGGITLGTQRGYAAEQEIVAKLWRTQRRFAGQHRDERDR